MSCLLLYATQTGTAEDTAVHLWRYFRALPLEDFQKPEVPLSIGDYDLARLASESRPIVFIISTTGDGEVPEEMRVFWRALLKKSIPKNAMLSVEFAVLGLGDTSYALFNAAARKMRARLKALGATELCAPALLDESDPENSELQLTRFQKELAKLICGVDAESERLLHSVSFPLFKVKPADSQHHLRKRSSPKWPKGCSEKLYKGRYREAVVISNEKLCSESLQDRDVRLLRMRVDEGSLGYHPGDVVYILPRNRSEIVDTFLQLFPVDGNSIVEISSQGLCLNVSSVTSIRELIYAQFDLNASPTRKLIELMSNHASDERERTRLKHLSSHEGADELYQYTVREKRTVLMVFRDFPSVRPPLADLLEMIPRLRPRAFSIASSPTFHKGEIHICISLVRYMTPLKKVREGVCSAFVKQSEEGDFVPFYVGAGTLSFSSLPSPVIMIGPGTGVAPFRSFLWELSTRADTKNFDTWLFFGCRHEDKDYLFQQEWRTLTEKGVLGNFVTAFSRDQQNKIYVQDRLNALSAQIGPLLARRDIRIFVAGAAGAMPRSVHRALVKALTQTGLSETNSERHLSDLSKSRQYQVETWQ
mmetsp:Transcript_2419/g.7230  ORF Transcript_2419/g.7230 Transcript_2419/m.7230 type:complete len:591 (+) Transcript_2419:97-1869(+)